ncbi:MAG: hypothetical protein U0X75_20690 [Acidobacteriota bacterium]
MAPMVICITRRLVRDCGCLAGNSVSGRLLTVLALIVCVGCVMRLCRAMTERRDSAWLAGLSVLTSLPVFHWSAVHRPDLPALALAFGALAATYPARAQSIGRTLFVAGLLTVAVFCKQTTVLPIVVIAARIGKLTGANRRCCCWQVRHSARRWRLY